MFSHRTAYRVHQPTPMREADPSHKVDGTSGGKDATRVSGMEPNEQKLGCCQGILMRLSCSRHGIVYRIIHNVAIYVKLPNRNPENKGFEATLARFEGGWTRTLCIEEGAASMQRVGRNPDSSPASYLAHHFEKSETPKTKSADNRIIDQKQLLTKRTNTFWSTAGPTGYYQYSTHFLRRGT